MSGEATEEGRGLGAQGGEQHRRVAGHSVSWQHVQGLFPRGPHYTSMVIPGAVLQEKGTSPAVPEEPHASSCSEVDGCLFVLC